jgi:hypothetical protein
MHLRDLPGVGDERPSEQDLGHLTMKPPLLDQGDVLGLGRASVSLVIRTPMSAEPLTAAPSTSPAISCRGNRS